MRCGFVTQPRWSEYRPPPLFVSSNANPPPMKTDRIAFGFVLVALIVSRPFFHVAVWIATRSGAAGGPGVSVIVVVRVMSNHFAVIVTVVLALTGLVVTGNALLALPLLMTRSAGTWTSAGLLVESCTFAPSGVAAVNVIVPVAGLPPVSVFATTETAVSDGPAGRAALTERFVERGVLPTHAVIWTIVSGAAAFVLIGNVAVSTCGGTTTCDGTLATLGSELNSRTVVLSASENARVTVPVAVAPSRTMDGSTDRDEMAPAADEPLGSRSTAAVAATVAASTRRRMRPPMGGVACVPGAGGAARIRGPQRPACSYPSGRAVNGTLGRRAPRARRSSARTPATSPARGRAPHPPPPAPPARVRAPHGRLPRLCGAGAAGRRTAPCGAAARRADGRAGSRA